MSIPTQREHSPTDAELMYGRVRRFHLQRHFDGSGVSGVGVVAQGVQFGDGTMVLRWLGTLRSTGVYDGGLATVEAIHGHSGDTEIIWLDPPPTIDEVLPRRR